MITVYADVLVGLNWFVNFFLFKGVSVIGKTTLKFWRNILASFLLGLSSLTIFLPELSAFWEGCLRIVLAGIGVLVGFGFRSIQVFVKNVGMLFAATFAYGGIMLGLWYVFHPQNLVIHNGVTYFDISPITLIIFTLTAYGVLWVLRKNFSKEPKFSPYVTLHIQKAEKTITFQAKVDTGFTVEDIYSHKPLVLFSPKICRQLAVSHPQTFRYLPYETVNGAGLLKAISVQEVTAQYQGLTTQFPEICGALAESDFHCSFDGLVGYDFIERMNRENEVTSERMEKHSGGVLQKTNRLYQRFGNLTATFKKGRRKAVNGTFEKR